MNENKPFFSVIVPVYNVEKYLHRCVDSILAQSYSDFEVLLVDDGSIDKSGAISDDYALKDNRIRVFHQANAGVSAARNKGIDEAKGEYVIFVDSDDYLLVDRLLHVWNNTKGHPDVISVDKDAVLCLGSNVLRLNKEIYLWASKMEVVWNAAYKRIILFEGHVRFLYSIVHGEDSLFFLEFLNHSKSIVFHADYDYVYEKGHVGGLNQVFQDFSKELEVYYKLGQARKTFYTSNGIAVGGEYQVNYSGEILRIIKSIYIGNQRRSYSGRISALKKMVSLLKIDKPNKGRTNSYKIITFLYNFKLYSILDCFMRLWSKRIEKLKPY